jgi:hypothetical protein
MKRKRNSYSIQEKTKIIFDYEKMKDNKSNSEIAEELNLKRTTLLTILENKNKIISNCEKNNINKMFSHFRNSNYPILDKCLFYWVNNINDNPKNCIMVNDYSIDYAINKFKNLLQIEGNISTSFIQRWRKRCGIKRYRIRGESQSCDFNSYQIWKSSTLSFIQENYEAANIFNLDESGLVFLNIKNLYLKEFNGRQCLSAHIIWKINHTMVLKKTKTASLPF